MRSLVRLTLLPLAITLFAAAASEGNASPVDGFQADPAMITQLAQTDDSSGSTRIRGRSIRGLIALGVAAVGGIGWVVKKMFGSDE